MDTDYGWVYCAYVFHFTAFASTENTSSTAETNTTSADRSQPNPQLAKLKQSIDHEGHAVIERCSIRQWPKFRLYCVNRQSKLTCSKLCTAVDSSKTTFCKSACIQSIQDKSAAFETCHTKCTKNGSNFTTCRKQCIAGHSS